MNEQATDTMSDRKKSTMILLIVIMVVVIPLGYFTKVIPYTFTAINCGGLPVKTSSHAGEKVYTLPGDRGYGVSVFSDYNYCTEDEAIEAGYEHTTLGQ